MKIDFTDQMLTTFKIFISFQKYCKNSLDPKFRLQKPKKPGCFLSLA